MNLKDALLKIEKLEKDNAKWRARFYNVNRKYQAVLLALYTTKEKKMIVQAKPFIPKTEKLKKYVHIDEADVVKTKEKKKASPPRRSKFQDIDFESLASETRYIDPNETVCPKCGEVLVVANEKVRYIVEAVETKVKVVKLIKRSFKCPKCNKTNNKLFYPLSNEVFPGSILTPSFASYLCYMKYELGIPFYHLESHFKNNLNLPITSSNMADYMEKVACRLTPIFNQMKEDLLSNSFKVIHADETPIEVKHRDDKSRKKSYVYVYSSSFYQETQIQIYEFNESRSSDKCAQWLKDYEGYIICDDYNGYDKIRKNNPNIKLQRCWVHAKRKFMDIVKILPESKRSSSVAYKISSKISELFNIENKIRDLKLNPLEIVTYRQKYSIPIVNEISTEINNANPKKGSALEGAINYITKIWDDLTPFINNGYLELSNNTAERAVRPFTILRKQFISFGSNNGGEITTKILSIIRTAINNGLDVYKYLEYVIQNINETNVNDLLPYSKNMTELFA